MSPGPRFSSPTCLRNSAQHQSVCPTVPHTSTRRPPKRQWQRHPYPLLSILCHRCHRPLPPILPLPPLSRFLLTLAPASPLSSSVYFTTRGMRENLPSSSKMGIKIDQRRWPLPEKHATLQRANAPSHSNVPTCEGPTLRAVPTWNVRTCNVPTFLCHAGCANPWYVYVIGRGPGR
jgi:hypothetical protein